MDLALLRQELSLTRHHDLDMLILFVTGQCNAKCRHCFYWQNLGGTHAGLSLVDMEKIARSAPSFRTLLLSGGEPTLRSDLPELIALFRTHNSIHSVSVPTNGLLPDRIAALARQVVKRNPHLLVTFNVSIDAFAESHDALRGVPGSFDAAMGTLKQLHQVAGEYEQFRVFVNSVICAETYRQIVPLAEHFQSLGLLDSHFFELIRGDPRDDRVKGVPDDELAGIYKKLLPIQERYIVREARRRRKGLMRMWRNVADIGNLIIRYRHQWRRYSQGKRWDFPCLAGEAVGVIDYDGRMRVCELREAGVHLVDYDYDFSTAWSSPVIRAETKEAQSHGCDCTHTCFVGASMRQSFWTRVVQSPWRYLQYKTWGKVVR